MPAIVYSPEDIVSAGAARALKEIVPFEEVEPAAGNRHFRHGELDLFELPKHHLYADHLDELGADLLIVLSRHSSAQSVPAFTVHPMGNWSTEARLGGRPKDLATAAPVAMLRTLRALSEADTNGLQVTYEATHHGPFLNTPSFYAEVGGNESTWTDRRLLAILAGSVHASLTKEAPYEKVALGIGGLHYESKFARLALEGKYAFAHMMSKHYVREIDMLEKAATRSSPRPEVAVIEWKSLSSETRKPILARLGEIGLDYVRV